MIHVIRELDASDEPAWLRFVGDIPAGEERFLKEDMTGTGAFRRRTEDRGWLVSVDGDEITGAVAVVPGAGWSSHVAELRLIVGGSRRGRGLGRALACRGLLRAFELACTHVYVEVVAEQTALVAMFKGLGFQPEALLADFVRDADGEPHDLMLLTHHAEDNWSALTRIGIAGAEA